jgi:hypothetical protein
MRVIDTRLDGSQLLIRLSGEYGHGDENLRCGRAVQNALVEALDRHDAAVSSVVIDYSNVNYMGGDGLIWSVSPAFRRRLAVRFVASGETYKRLSELLSATNMGFLIHLEMCGDQ